MSLRGSLRAAARAAFLVLVALPLALVAQPASAHPLGNFTVNRYTGMLVAPDGVTLDHVLDLAEIPTAQLGDRLDDLPRLGRDQCTAAATGLRLTVAGRSVPLSVVSSAAHTRPGQGGLPITRITCRLTASATITRDGTTVSLTDRVLPGQIGWQEITAVGNRTTLTSSTVPTKSTSRRLEAYPKDLLSSPLHVTHAQLVVRPGGPAATLPGISSAQRVTHSGALLSEATTLIDTGGVGAGVLAVCLALALGAGHALAPGHGKTVMAFYLSQRHGAPVRSAVAVGATVTAAHTGSVLLLGILVSASTTFVPVRIYPWLALVTGVLILGLGVSLLRQARHTHDHPHAHSHDHDHPQPHHHPHHHTHEHPQVSAAGGGRRGLAAMGLVGGLVPSPSALVLLLGAVALGKAAFGVLLVLAFGLGMATTLAVVGLLATGLLGKAERLMARRTRLAVPLRAVLVHGAAVGVCLIGVGVMLRAAGGLA